MRNIGKVYAHFTKSSIIKIVRRENDDYVFDECYINRFGMVSISRHTIKVERLKYIYKPVTNPQLFDELLEHLVTSYIKATELKNKIIHDNTRSDQADL